MWDNKYIVLKTDDVVKHCDLDQRLQLEEIVHKISMDRADEGKTPENEYIVINKDESYTNEVLEVMRKYGHWEHKEYCVDCQFFEIGNVNNNHLFFCDMDEESPSIHEFLNGKSKYKICPGFCKIEDEEGEE